MPHAWNAQSSQGAHFNEDYIYIYIKLSITNSSTKGRISEDMLLIVV